MTRKEAISWLFELKESEGEDVTIYEEDVEALEMAITSLEVDEAYQLEYETSKLSKQLTIPPIPKMILVNEDELAKHLIAKRLITEADKLLNDIYKCEGGESWFRIDGQEFNTDAGYAIEGMEIFVKLLRQRLEEDKK